MATRKQAGQTVNRWYRTSHKRDVPVCRFGKQLDQESVGLESFTLLCGIRGRADRHFLWELDSRALSSYAIKHDEQGDFPTCFPLSWLRSGCFSGHLSSDNFVLSAILRSPRQGIGGSWRIYTIQQNVLMRRLLIVATCLVITRSQSAWEQSIKKHSGLLYVCFILCHNNEHCCSGQEVC